ncbi:MAG: response regulator [Candidatus Omnitrophica bacterium]|nr:response regulator [Candidatus Omnitrophota bacterium]
MAKNKIMLIDDDQDLLQEFKEALDLSGYDVFAVSDSTVAVAAVLEQAPDLILLDLSMPRKSGFQVAGELRKIPRLKHIPIIAITGFFTEDEHSLLMNICGIKNCIKKPFDLADVIGKVEEILKKKEELWQRKY